MTTPRQESDSPPELNHNDFDDDSDEEYFEEEECSEPLSPHASASKDSTGTAHASKEEYFKAIEYLFFIANPPKFQKRWLDGAQVVKAITDIGQRPMSPSVKDRVYDASKLLTAIEFGAGGKHEVGHEFDCESNKRFFFFKDRTREGTKYYLYVDGSIDSKTVPRPRPRDGDWVDDVQSLQLRLCIANHQKATSYQDSTDGKNCHQNCFGL